MSGQKRDRRAIPIRRALGNLDAQRASLGGARAAVADDGWLGPVLADARAKIDEYGFAVIAVGGSDQAGPFAYTVGLTRLRHPELIVTGLPPDTAQDVLSDAAEMVRSGRTLSPGDRVDEVIGGGYQVVIAGPVEPAGNKAYKLNIAWRVFSNPGKPLQVVYPDDGNRFPWDPGYTTTMQPLLALPPQVGPAA